MAGGVETAAPEAKHPESKPAVIKSAEVAAPKIVSPKSAAGDLGAASAAQTQPSPSVLEPLSKPEPLSADQTSSSISPAPQPDVTGNIAGESDTLKAIAPEDRTTKSLGPMADIMASRDPEPIETERISTAGAPLSRPADGSVVSPYVIPQVPTKTGFHFIGIFVISVGIMSILGSVSLASILTANYSDYKPLTDIFQPVIGNI